MKSRTLQLSLAGLFTALTIVGAYIRIPLPLVPITLQTFFVWLSGFVLGPAFGAMSQLLYLLIGLVGFPVFAKGGGPAYVLQPTFGYLLGFPLASGLIGFLAHGPRKELTPAGALQNLRGIPNLRLLLIGVAGMLAVFIPGVLYLYFVGNRVAQLHIGLDQAVWTGFLVFVPGDLLKLAGIVAVLRLLEKRIIP